jgi:hypothetical protein
MNFSSLNKTITMFLVGALTTSFFIIIFFDRLKLIVVSSEMGAAVSATTVAFAAVPVSLLLGALFDSLSDLTVRRWICGQGRGNYESFIKFLGQMNMLKSHDL